MTSASYLNPTDRARLEEIIAVRNSPRKWVWRADIVLATAGGRGTNANIQRRGKSKPCVWRWQERYIDEGVPGRLSDKTRPSCTAPLAANKKPGIIEKAVCRRTGRKARFDLLRTLVPSAAASSAA
jgi:hypothetical protein